MADVCWMILVGVILMTAIEVHGDCDDHDDYNDLIDDLNKNPCMTDTEVWQRLEGIYYSCRDNLAREMYNKFRHVDYSHQCHCVGSYSNYKYSHSDNGYHCPSYYYDQLNHYKSKPACATHHIIWSDLRHIPMDNDDYNPRCLSDLVHTVNRAMKYSPNTCSCSSRHTLAAHTTVKPKLHTSPSQSNREVCQNPEHDCKHEVCDHGYHKQCVSSLCTCLKNPTPTTEAPTTHHTTTALPHGNCDAVKVLSSVAHNEPAGNHSSSCRDHVHVEVVYFIHQACTSIPSRSHQWTRGLKIKDHCSTLPHYTAVAHFVGSHFDKNYKTSNAGVFIGCENGDIKIVTEDCASNMHVKHIALNSIDSGNYYVIKQN